MLAQNISCYIKLEQLPREVKSRHNIKLEPKWPRFDATEIAGYYKPFEQLKNAKGQMILNLLDTRDIDTTDRRKAERRLQARNSLNLSSVFTVDYCKPDGAFAAWGYPDGARTYGKAQKRDNPFYQHGGDLFLFVISPDWETIEILVIEGGKETGFGSAKMLADGGFDERLEAMRAGAQTFYQY